MRRLMIPLVLAAALALPATASSGPGGLSAKQLSDSGWTCFNVVSPVVGPLGVHCAPPGVSFPPTGQPVIQLLYFFNTTDPNSDVPDFTASRRSFERTSIAASRARPSRVRMADTPTCRISGSR